MEKAGMNPGLCICGGLAGAVWLQRPRQVVAPPVLINLRQHLIRDDAVKPHGCTDQAPNRAG